MTQEMETVINAPEKHIAVQAYAGSGKSSTMVEYIKAHPNEKILFLVYNKAMSVDFSNRIKFVKHRCTVKTIHSLAYRWYFSNHESKSLETTTILDIKAFFKKEHFDYFTLSKIKFYFDMFLASSFEKVLDMKPVEAKDKKLFKYVDRLWKYYIGKSMSFSHNVYLKLFQLSKPKLDYDTILVDEFNDINDCMLDIVLNNLDKKVIVVGDSYQMINAFNFNTSGLKTVVEDYKFKEYKLTNSFRIEEDIAEMSCKYLSSMYNEDISFHGLGNTQLKDLVLQNSSPANQINVLCRTRLGGIKFIYNFLSEGNNKKKKVFYPGGLNSFKINEIEKMLKFNGTIYLAGERYTVPQLKSMIEDGLQDPEIIRIVATWEFVQRNPDVIEVLRASETNSMDNADIVLLTAHSSKGLTLKNVLLSSDFKDCVDLKKDVQTEHKHSYKQRLADSEVNLLYVALTRATDYLDINNILNEESGYFADTCLV